MAPSADASAAAALSAAANAGAAARSLPSLSAADADVEEITDLTQLLVLCATPNTSPAAAEALLGTLASGDREALSAALSAADPSGMTPLIAATRRGWPSIVRRLLALGADPVGQRLVSSGNTAVHLAALGGQLEVLKELLPPIIVPSEQQPPTNQNTSASSTTVTNSHLVNAGNHNGDTPLMFACGSGGARQAAVTSLLLNRGADPTLSNSSGITAAMVAAGQGQSLPLQALLRYKAQQGGSSVLSAVDGQGNGPLAFASRAGGCKRQY